VYMCRVMTHRLELSMNYFMPKFFDATKKSFEETVK
jgi:hypothetical protein